MAILYKTDGTITRVHAHNGKWRLGELQELVGGNIELTPWAPNVRLVINEQGVGLKLPLNPAATLALHEDMANELGCTVDQLAAEVGKRLHYLPQLRGDVVLLEEGEDL